MAGEHNIEEQSNGDHLMKHQQTYESSGGIRGWLEVVPQRRQSETVENGELIRKI